MPQRTFYSVFSTDLPRAKDWYVSLLGYDVVFESDWFIHLRDKTVDTIEVGILARDIDLVPPERRAAPAGGMLTVVVDDVDQTHRAAEAAGLEILEAPRDLFYGQRRMLLSDPDGQLVDVSSDCEPDPAWLASLSEQ